MAFQTNEQVRRNYFLFKSHNIRHRIPRHTYIDITILVLRDRIKYILFELDVLWKEYKQSTMIDQ